MRPLYCVEMSSLPLALLRSLALMYLYFVLRALSSVKTDLFEEILETFCQTSDQDKEYFSSGKIRYIHPQLY